MLGGSPSILSTVSIRGTIPSLVFEGVVLGLAGVRVGVLLTYAVFLCRL